MARISKPVLTVIAVVVIAGLIVGGLLVGFGERGSKQTKDTSSMTAQTAGSSMDSMDMQPSGTAVQSNAVTISDYKFAADHISVKAGTTVTWTNTDDVQHSVIADSASADAPSGPLFGRGQTYSFTFAKAGTYSYHCGPHTYMKGIVTVTN